MKQYANIYIVSSWLAEASVWMNTAVRLDSESNRKSYHKQKNDFFNYNKLNVAYVCTGIAFELGYKSLLATEFKPLKRTHEVQKLHKMLKQDTQQVIEGYIKKTGWNDITWFLKYIDSHMTTPDRRYSFDNSRRGEKTGFAIQDGMFSIPILSMVLNWLVSLGLEHLEKARTDYDSLISSLYSYRDLYSSRNKSTKKNQEELKNKALDSIKKFRDKYGNIPQLPKPPGDILVYLNET